MDTVSEYKRYIYEVYNDKYKTFGYSPKALGWDKGKQDIRFDVLTSLYDFNNKSVLDIGCGFGDLNRVLNAKFNNYTYLGVDLVENLIHKGRELYTTSNIRFKTGDILEMDLEEPFDFATSSGVFNYKFKDFDTYWFIEEVIKKALKVCKDGIAFDFLSDKVDYQLEHTFHSSPEKILGMAYKYSRNVVLRNDYMPFEFSLFIFKDDSFTKHDTLFNRYKQQSRG